MVVERAGLIVRDALVLRQASTSGVTLHHHNSATTRRESFGVSGYCLQHACYLAPDVAGRRNGVLRVGTVPWIRRTGALWSCGDGSPSAPRASALSIGHGSFLIIFIADSGREMGLQR
jgi:hypothetical protein